MFVGHAAANTIATAVDDFQFEPYDHRVDRDLDPEGFESSYLVASALQADCLRMEIQNYAVLFGNGTCRLLCRKLCEFIN